MLTNTQITSVDWWKIWDGWDFSKPTFAVKNHLKYCFQGKYPSDETILCQSVHLLLFWKIIDLILVPTKFIITPPGLY